MNLERYLPLPERKSPTLGAKQNSIMYRSLYAHHQRNARKRYREEEQKQETEKRMRMARSDFSDLADMPALSGFMRMHDFRDSTSAARAPVRLHGDGLDENDHEEEEEEDDFDAAGQGQQHVNAQSRRSVSIAGNLMAPRMDGFQRMEKCRIALDALDQGGWKRSYHQRMFHEAYIAACARPFWKLDPPGSFARAHQRILEINNWDSLSQEILISTPRRFGKTISVSMFAAALMFSCAGCEVSIYSTCKRISTKLLRNVTMFLGIIYDVLKCGQYKVLRGNQEEVHIQGNEGPRDVRIIQSYPSKVRACAPQPQTPPIFR